MLLAIALRSLSRSARSDCFLVRNVGQRADPTDNVACTVALGHRLTQEPAVYTVGGTNAVLD